MPIRFTDDMPLLTATLDGKRGLFGLDTGNSGPLMLFPTWAHRNGLSRYYGAGVPEQEGGEGGMFTSHMAFIRSLRIRGLSPPGNLLGLLTPHGVGATSNPSEAGNLGMTAGAHSASLSTTGMSAFTSPRVRITPPTGRQKRPTA